MLPNSSTPTTLTCLLVLAFTCLPENTMEKHSDGILDSTSPMDPEKEQGSCHTEHLETKCFSRQLGEARVASNLAPTGSIP